MTIITDNNRSLIDPFQRKIEYLRLSVTDKCNMRCFYCMPKGFKGFEQPEHWLNFDEIERVIAAFAELGVSRIRVTGGEPLVRKNINELVSRIHQLPGVEDLSLSTNATLLAQHADSLYEAGVSRLNISLDSLRPERFKKITGSELQPVIDGMMAAKAAGFSPIKINMLAMKDINDDEFEDVVEYCIENDFTLRFIETMPMGDDSVNASDHYLDLAEVKDRLAQRYDLIPGVMPGGGPARYVQEKILNYALVLLLPYHSIFVKPAIVFDYR